MWKFSMFSGLILLGAANLFAVTEGLDCYTCYAENSTNEYQAVDSGIQGSASCKFGNIPNSTLNKACPVDKDDAGKELPSVCMMLYAERPISETLIAKVTVRGCLHPTGDLVGMDAGCYNKTYKEMATFGMEPTLDLISTSFGPVPETTPAYFCQCKGDGCNGGDGGGGGKRKVSLVALWITLWTAFASLFY